MIEIPRVVNRIVGARESPRGYDLPRPARFYRPELDGLRFLAFLGVFLSHALPGDVRIVGVVVDSGWFGVDLFFLLSAFLITELLLREYDARGFIDARAFLVRRALRIWPLFFAFLAVTSITDRFFHHTGLSLGYMAAFVGFVGNWACGLFGWQDSAAMPLWSVSIEEQFYLIWPFVVARVGPRPLRLVAIAILGIAAMSRLVTVGAGAVYPAVWVTTPCRLDPIACGVLLALWLRARRQWAPPTAMRLALVAGGLMIWCLAVRQFSVMDDSILAVSVLYPCVALGAVGIFLGSYGEGRGPFRLLVSRPFIYLGRISYGLYVVHSLALDAVGTWLWPGRGVAPALAGLVVTVALAGLSYQFLELPFLRLKQRFTVVPSREP